MPKLPAGFPKYLEKHVYGFDAFMGAEDELMATILKGHLYIERMLDNIIALIFYHPEHIFENRFGFSQKFQIARAYALRKDKHTPWAVIAAINSLRNEIAHQSNEDGRKKRLERLRDVYRSDAPAEVKEKLGDDCGALLVRSACASCVGFLGIYEDDLEALRGTLDAMDAARHPDRERVPPVQRRY